MAAYDNLPDIPGVDWEQAYNNTLDMDLLFNVVSEFCINAHRELEELNGYFDTYFATGDDTAMENYRIKVHAMKNSAALVGAVGVSEDAKALEYASRDRNVDIVKRDNAAFSEKYSVLAQIIAETMDIDTSSASKELDVDEFKADLETLKEAFDSFDIETLNDTMDKIQTVNVDAKAAAFVAKLASAVLTLDEDTFKAGYDGLVSYFG